MRVVRVSTADVHQCNACGGDHKDIALYDAIGGPGINVPEGATKAIVCPDQDYTVVLIDTGHIRSEIEGPPPPPPPPPGPLTPPRPPHDRPVA